MKIKDFLPFLDRASVNYGNDDRIIAVMNRAKKGMPMTVGFIGGSITHGSMSTVSDKCYAKQVYQWFVERFDGTEVGYKNAAIGGTDSVYGVHRMRQDLLVAKPDIVIVEFSVNDMDVDNVEEAYEAMLVRLLMEAQKPGVIIVNTMFYNNGASKQDVHNSIAMKYNLPIISVRNGLWDEIEAGKLKANLLTADDLHPNDLGHRVMAEMIINQLKKIYEKSEKNTEFTLEKINMQKLDNPFLKSCLLKNNELLATVNQGWCVDDKQAEFIGDMFSGGWYIENAEGKLSFKIRGRRVAIQFKRYIGDVGGVAQVRVDGDDQRIKLDGNFVDGWGDTVMSLELVHEADPSWHEIEVDFELFENRGKYFYITAFMVAP